MYRILIADDEPWVIESLRKGIPWEAEGFEVVATASDGEAALAAIESTLPDVVFTDIRMPVLSGLDLIREARARGYRCIFVVVSGYAEFAYAQKALQYGVSGYCVKPVESEEVIAILRRISRTLAHRSGRVLRVPEAVLRAADTGDATPLADLLQREPPGGLPSGPFRVLVHSGDPDEFDLESIALVTTGIGSGRRVSILSEEAYQTCVRGSDRPSRHDQPVGVSSVVAEAAGIGRAVLEAIVASNHGFMGARAALVEYNPDSDPAALRLALQTIERGIESASVEQIDRGFGELRTAVRTERYQAMHAAFVYNSIIYFLGSTDRERDEPLVEYEDLVDLYGEFDAMLAHLQDLCCEAVGASHADQTASAAPADDIVRYVEANFVGRITLSELARRFSLSPSHLARVFKGRTGKPVTEFVAQLRIDYARQLLRSSEMPVGDVAEEAGYDSYFYFARVFKRRTGTTPSEYRAGAVYDTGPA